MPLPYYLCPYEILQDSVGKIALLTRRKVTEVPAQYGVDVPAEEASGRLVQHVEGYLQSLVHCRCSLCIIINL